MAKKRDPSAPKGRVKPGTPSKLLPGKVFGYHGKYVWKTTFDAQTKAREAAKKGSSLVKRTTSAITKTTKNALAKAPKGEIVKINRGDSAVVKAAKRAYNAGSRTRSVVNKIYEAGKTTRRVANTTFKAGQEARKVHDKIVKGGKEVVKGAYEGGKDTKRAVNRLKPGGKIVKSKGGTVTKYAKKPTSIVKTKGSKITPYKKPSKGKLVTTKKVTPTTPKKTPVSQRRINAKLELERSKKGTTKDTAFNRKYKVKGSSTNPWKTNKKGQITNAYDWNKAKRFAKKTIQKGVNLGKSSRALKIAKGVGKVGGVVEKITLPLALIQQTGQHINQLKNLGVVPGSGNFGKRLTLDQKNVRDTGDNLHNRLYAARKKRLAKQDAKSKYDKSKKGVVTTKSEKPTTTTRVHNKNKLVGGGNAGRSTDSGGTSGNNQKVTIKKNNNKGKIAGAYAAGYLAGKSKKQGSNNNKVTINKNKKGKSKAQLDWEKKTRNSPARKSGAFDVEQLWKQHLKHKAWKKKRGRK